MKRVIILFLVLLLTILTQVGGIVFLICLLIYPYSAQRLHSRPAIAFAKTGIFILLYALCSMTIVPYIAGKMGRVPLPVFRSEKGIASNSLMTCLLNRHYVRKEMMQTLDRISDKMAKENGAVSICYLDACFPFINGFPLLPHLSHNDGKKLDLTYYYTGKLSQQEVHGSPSWLGYGFCEEPTGDEVCTPCECSRRGFYQYSMLKYLVRESLHKRYEVNTTKTAQLIRIIAAEPSISMIFIEPHLKQRWHLGDVQKIHFHGCHAVRHDDHIHIQIK